MNNETKYKYINSLPREYHKIICPIMIIAESGTLKDSHVRLDKGECKLIMRYLYKITTMNKKLDNELKHKTKQYEFLRHRDNIAYYENILNKLTICINILYENEYISYGDKEEMLKIIRGEDNGI